MHEPTAVTYTGPRLGSAAMGRIKEQHSIVAVLARMGIDLPQQWDGRSDFRLSPCPIPGCPGSGHNAASFVVHPQTNSWHCFRQDDGGDVLELVRQVTGASLWRVAKILDSREPIVLPDYASLAGSGRDANSFLPKAASTSEQPDLGRTSAQRVRTINAMAWRFYTLPRLAEQGRRYLRGRGIDVVALEAEVGRPLTGYTPRSNTGLVDHLRSKGCADDEIVDAGWAIRRLGDVRLKDKYRGRALLPFRDEQDRVVGVTGRSVTWRTGDTYPKYLNHPRTTAFDKSAVLYRPSTSELDENATVIACEGTLDALAIAAAGARLGASNRYAPCSQSGLSLTDRVAERFFALHSRPPVLCGDGDDAGQKATVAWVQRAMCTYHREVLTLTLPNGMDPAEWLQQRGDRGLIAFTRAGCLTDADNVRPKPAGALLARYELDRAMTVARAANPDAESVMVASIVIERLARRALDVSDDAARKRFAYAAGHELSKVMDGGKADQRSAQMCAAIGHEATRTRGSAVAQFEATAAAVNR